MVQGQRIPPQDFRVVLQWCLQWPFLQGLAGTEAWDHEVGGEPRWLYNNLQVLEFHLCLGKAHSPSGGLTVLSSVWVAGSGAPRLPVVLTHVAQGEYQHCGHRSSNGALYPLLGAHCTIHVSLPYLLSPNARDCP